MSLHHLQTPLRPISDHMGSLAVQLDRAVANKLGTSIIQAVADAGGWQAPPEEDERYRSLELAMASRGTCYAFKGQLPGTHDAWSLAKACAEAGSGRDGIDAEREVGTGVAETEARKVLTQWGLTEVKVRHAAPGDFLLFDMGARGFHVAIMSAPGGELSWAMLPGRKLPEPKIIHAYDARAVVESWCGPFWMDRLVAAFSFDKPPATRGARLFDVACEMTAVAA